MLYLLMLESCIPRLVLLRLFHVHRGLFLFYTFWFMGVPGALHTHFQSTPAAGLSPAGAAALARAALFPSRAGPARDGSGGGGGGRHGPPRTDGRSHGGGGAGAVPAAPDADPNADDVLQLTCMGYSVDQATAALLSTDGNLDQAAALLFDDNDIQVQ